MLANFFTGLVKRFLPNAFLFAVVLTFVVFLLGIVIEGKTPVEMLQCWGDNYWGLLSFAMQMVLVLSTGHTLAKTDFVASILEWLSKRAKTPRHAIIIVTVSATVACWINWGFGLIVGALIAREMARRVKGVHYPLMVASAYSGYMVWHSGLSGSIPLTVAQEPTGVMAEIAGGIMIPISQTIFAWQTVTIMLVLFFTLPILNCLMMPKEGEEIVEFEESETSEPNENEENKENKETEPLTLAEKIENSTLITALIGIMGVSYLAVYFYNGGTIHLNAVNFIFLFAGMILHKTPIAFLKAFNDAIKSTGGIILQFPLYAGIMGMIVHSGLATTISEAFVKVSNTTTFPFFTFLSSGLVNFFVPSGGGHWVVQGPIIMPAAQEIGTPLWKAAMSIAWGDSWSNMVQPFWTVPLLSIAGLSVRDIMGYCTVVLLWGLLVIGLGLVFL
jgi:short-chain fatty acids transporter